MADKSTLINAVNGVLGDRRDIGSKDFILEAAYDQINNEAFLTSLTKVKDISPNENGEILYDDIDENLKSIISMTTRRGVFKQVQPSYINTEPFPAPVEYTATYYYYLVGDRVVFTSVDGYTRRLPDAPVTINYYVNLERLVSDTDSNWVLDNAFNVYLYAALYHGYMYIEQHDKAAGCLASYNTFFQNMIDNDRSKAIVLGAITDSEIVVLRDNDAYFR